MSNRKLKVDFSGVEAFQRAGEGQHVAKIASAEEKQSQGGNDMISVKFEVTKGADKGSCVFENYPLVENALWKLKGLLQAIGLKADGKVALDLDKLIGKCLIIEVKHEEYEGKTRAKIDEVKKLSAVADDDDEDDEDTEDEDDEDEVEAPVKKPEKKAQAKSKKPMNPPEEDDEDEDDEDWGDDDEDEEEEEKPKKKAPVKKAPAKKAAPAKKSKKKPEPEEDEDDEDDEDDDWDDEE